MSQFFASGSQIIRASASASVLPMNIQEWFPLGFPLCCPRDSQESFPTSQPQNINSYVLRFLYGPILISMHDYWKKAIILTRRTIVVKAMFLLFNMLSSFVIVFLLRSKRLLISWLQSTCAVILEPPKISLSLFPLFPHLFVMKWWDQMPWSLFFECCVLSQFFTLLFHFHQEAL